MDQEVPVEKWTAISVRSAPHHGRHTRFRHALRVLFAIVAILFSSAETGAEAVTAAGNDGFITDWIVCGPFPNGLDENRPSFRNHEKSCWGFTNDFLSGSGDETSCRPKSGSKTVFSKKKFSWIQGKAVSSLVDFNRVFGDSPDCVAYAYAEITAEEEETGLFLAGSDDGIRIFINGVLVHDHHVGRGARKDEDAVSVRLEKGLNRVLVKVDNGYGGFGFYLRKMTSVEEKTVILPELMKKNLTVDVSNFLAGSPSTPVRLNFSLNAMKSLPFEAAISAVMTGPDGTTTSNHCLYGESPVFFPGKGKPGYYKIRCRVDASSGWQKTVETGFLYSPEISSRVNSRKEGVPMPEFQNADTSKWESMKYGLFVHHVYGGEFSLLTPLGPSGDAAKDIDDFVGRFDVDRWADDVAAMGFEYVIFTAWHANMNALYPSRRMTQWRGPGHATARRDLLGEIIDALLARNIQPALYTHVWVGEDFHPAGSGYYRYDRQDGIVTDDMKRTGYYPSASGENAEVWNDFINDIYDEMCARYGKKVAAMYFDGSWSWKIDKQRLMGTIRRHNPDCALVANGTPDHGFPFCSKEVGSPEGKEYGFNGDYPPVVRGDVGTWPGYVRHVALIQGGNWWASRTGRAQFDAKTVYLYTVLQASANTQGGGIGWAFGPYADGTWEKDILETMKQAYAYMKPVESSIKGTTSSLSYPTPEGTKISNLPCGIASTSSVDGKKVFLHVLRPPGNDTLLLPVPADGKKFTSAIILRTGENAELKQDSWGVRVRVPGGWDDLDTVIQLNAE